MIDIKTKFTDISFNNELSKFYLTIANKIYVYDYETFTPIKTYSVDGEGYFLFNHKDHLVVVGKEKSPNTGKSKTYILKTTLPNP